MPAEALALTSADEPAGLTGAHSAVLVVLLSLQNWILPISKVEVEERNSEASLLSNSVPSACVCLLVLFFLMWRFRKIQKATKAALISGV